MQRLVPEQLATLGMLGTRLRCRQRPVERSLGRQMRSSLERLLLTGRGMRLVIRERQQPWHPL